MEFVNSYKISWRGTLKTDNHDHDGNPRVLVRVGCDSLRNFMNSARERPEGRTETRQRE